ncbi:MAG: hypothetical protein U9P73_08385 [Candidatus Cloacimonadota bacterium]|nr:hypothetical protein [Candidatus Cloacimonadota bacterium]
MKKIFIILVILIILLLALIVYQKSKVTDEVGIKITYNNRETFISYSEIRSIKQVSFTTERCDKFNGSDFAEVLKILKIPTDIRTEYIFHSKDGGTLNLVKDENETFYLVFQEDAAGQFIRLVVPTDEFSQRWIKYLVTIEIK